MKKLFILCALYTCSSLAVDSPVKLLGERLFKEKRFSEKYFKVFSNDPNGNLKEVKDKDQLFSCQTCHQTVSIQNFDLMTTRAYSDFFAKTVVPIRADGLSKTLRNTPPLIGIGSKFSQNDFSHHDGELLHKQTVLGNYTGRNMGWLPNQKSDSLKNIVRILKHDNGQNTLGKNFGGPYSRVLLGVDPTIPNKFRLPKNWRLDVFKATDKEILEYIEKVGEAYLKSLDFEKDENGNYNGSPYDQFLLVNNISRAPKENQTNFDYTVEIFRKLRELENPTFIKKKYFPSHNKYIGFNEREWKGLKAFFGIGATSNSGRGMCINCHTAPLFTDQFFHNIGVSQVEYENVHGSGTFQNIHIPNLKERDLSQIQFLKEANKDNLNDTDLGVWNFFAKPEKKTLTNFLMDAFCGNNPNCSKERLLPFLIARFKTPGLRNLSHSNPYFHNGSEKTLRGTVKFYKDVAELIQKREIINPAPQVSRIRMNDEDIDNITAFLESLNEELVFPN